MPSAGYLFFWPQKGAEDMPGALGRQQDQPSRGGQPGSTARVARPGVSWTKGRWAERQQLWPLLRVDSTQPEGLQDPKELPGRSHVGAEARLFQKIPSQVPGQDMWEVTAPETGV